MYRIFNWIFHSRVLFAFVLMGIFYGLFLIPNSGNTNRVWGEINNLGHIGALFIVWVFIFNLFPRFTRLSTTRLFLVVMATTMIAAELIEIIQGWIGRDDEWQDVWDSGVGALLAFTLFSIQTRQLSRWPRLAWRSLALIALVVVPWSIWSALTDEVMLRRQFPILCDFSTPFELSRWHADAAAIRLADKNRAGRQYLDAAFRPAPYSTISLKYFYRDWRGYGHIVFDLTNPERTDLRLKLRMHDHLHKRHHFAFNDRFNRTLTLKPGRQLVSIALVDVLNAPATRKMDLRHMADISLFTIHSRSYHHLYLHKIYLE